MQTLNTYYRKVQRQAVLLLVFLLLTATAHAEKREVHILSTNDMHAALEAMPQLAAIADSLRTLYPNLLVFSAGDNRTGNPLCDQYEIPAYPIVALMNQIGFNGSALGNHEFDANSLPRLIGLSNFRYICANIHTSPESGISCVPYQVFDVEGLKVGVIGSIELSSRGIPDTHPNNLHGVSFTQPMEAVAQYEWLSRECNATILLSHTGYEADVEMAKAFSWLDLIIGGHTHKQLKGNEVVNGILITQNRHKLHRATHITLTVDSGRVVGKQAEYIDVKQFPKKNELVEEVVHYFSDNPAFRRVLAQAEAPFDNDQELAIMVCDAYKDRFNADIAIENHGGVRIEHFPAGDIRVLDVLAMEPFDNNAVELTLTGEELRQLLQSYSRGSIWHFPYLSGLVCELTPDPADPQKLKSFRMLKLNGTKFDMKRTYRVVTNSYVASVSKTLREEQKHDTNVQTSDIIMRYLETQGKVNYQGRRCLLIKNK